MTNENATDANPTTEHPLPEESAGPRRWKPSDLPRWPNFAAWSDVFTGAGEVLPDLSIGMDDRHIVLTHPEWLQPLRLPTDPREGWAILCEYLFSGSQPMLRFLEAQTLFYRSQLLTAGVVPDLSGTEELRHNWPLCYLYALILAAVDAGEFAPFWSWQLDKEQDERLVPRHDDLLCLKYRALRVRLDSGELAYTVDVNIERRGELVESPAARRTRTRTPRKSRASETPAAPAADESPEHG